MLLINWAGWNYCYYANLQIVYTKKHDALQFMISFDIFFRLVRIVNCSVSNWGVGTLWIVCWLNFDEQDWELWNSSDINLDFHSYRFWPLKPKNYSFNHFLGVPNNTSRMFMINFMSSRSTHVSYCYFFLNNIKIYSKNIFFILILIEMMFLSHRWIFQHALFSSSWPCLHKQLNDH